MYLLGFDIGSSSVKAAIVDAATGRCVASTKKMKIDKILIYIALLWAVLALSGTLNAQEAMGNDASGHSHTGHPKNKVVAPSYASRWGLIC